MNQTSTAVSASTAEREIVTTRLVNAPRAVVFKAWTDPIHVAQWWGPNGFTNTIQEMDVRPGGVWRFVMHGPDGIDYQNRCNYVEVARPERLIYDHVSGPRFRATATFEEEGGKTRVTLRMVFESTTTRDKVIQEFGAVEGAKQTLARLDAYLATMSDRDFVITRVFAAPREPVYKAWTDPQLLAQWWGPQGFTNPVCDVDVRRGGAFRIVMRGPDGAEYPLTGVFQEVVANERLVKIDDCSEHPAEWHDLVNPKRDKTQKPTLKMTTTVNFDPQSDKTKLTIRTRFESAALRDAFVKIGMNDGWSQSLERLADLLAIGRAQ